MMLLNIWMTMMVFVGVATSADGEDHNHKAHKALCDLMKAAVGKWGTSGESLSPPLKKALGKTLFGKDDGGKVDTLKSFPEDYDDLQNRRLSTRSLWCGEPYDGDSIKQKRWSGHSAPHDMVCLCTKGEKGWPLNGTEKKLLCGKPKEALGGGEKGWRSISSDSDALEGKDQIQATWANVTVPCLEGERENDLKQALNTFLGELENQSIYDYPNRYQLGKGSPTESSACTGSKTRGICVEYYNSTGALYPMPWWTQLQDALVKDAEIQKQREEEERRKEQGETEKQDLPQTAALTSAPPTTNQADQQQNSNLTDKLRRFNLTSGTPISMPTSWLLSAAFFI